MIDFQPVRLEDKEPIERFTLTAQTPNCDLSFANMYCWRERYHSEWAVVGGYLVIRFQIDGGRRTGYMQPLGDGDFSEIIPLLEADARENGQRLRIIGLNERGREILRRTCPDRFAFASLRAAEDYIYRAEDLRTLAGRRYQSKRNHINRFTAAYPDYRYEALTPQHAEECLALERQWQRERDNTANDADLMAERRAMQLGFAHFERLGMRGGALYVGSRLVAFTYGSALNRNTFDIHAEKADTSYEGAFTMINRLFAATLPPEFEYINREEDLGIAGLRKSKLSYHPFLQRKFTALDLHPDERQCRELWSAVFGDDEEFIDRFIVHHYHRSTILSFTADRRMVAMLHLLPFESPLGPATYIYGVATHPDYRGRGYARNLMLRAMHTIGKNGSMAAFLIPDPTQPWLRGFYAKFSFSGAVPVSFSSFDDFDFGTGNPATDLAMIWRADDSMPLPSNLTVEEISR